MDKKDFYFLGKITRTHGLAGNIILKLDTDQPEFYNKLEGVFVEINGLLTPFFIEKQQWSKDNSKIVTLKNASLQLSEQLVGKDVYLPLSTLPKLHGNQFYYHEVLGFEIQDQCGNSAGIIHQINDQTMQHYFISDLDGKEIIVPIIKNWIIEVSRDKKYIKMELPDGLLDVFILPSTNDEV